MKRLVIAAAVAAVLSVPVISHAQLFSLTREQMIEYTTQNPFDRFADGRPKVPDALVDRALAYNRDFVAPALRRRKPDANEAAALAALDEELAATDAGASAEELQSLVYAIGNDPHYGLGSLRDWFKALYETLLGSSQGPRMGSFIALYGVDNTRALIAEALAEEPRG